VAYKVILKRSAEKSLQALPKKIQARIVGAIDLLSENPFPPASLKLKGREGYRIRTNDYRILYTVKNEILTVCVLAIGHRKEIYRR
jgi:mRNA interferase RelE/StbE